MQDLIILGGGPAGYLAAERAAHRGMKVTLFEMRELGGVCLNEGCIPSKALLNSAKVYEHAKNGRKFGVLTAPWALMVAALSLAVSMGLLGMGYIAQKQKSRKAAGVLLLAFALLQIIVGLMEIRSFAA